MVNRITTAADAGLPDAPPLSQTVLLNDGSIFSTIFDPGVAWSIYLAHVAQSLIVERSGGVSWSVTSYSPDQLKRLFDSASLFELGPAGYAVLRFHHLLVSHGAATPSDPARTFRFLRGGALIGSTPRDTVARLLGWCRDNLEHYASAPRPLGHPTDLNAYWQYGGWPPVARVIAGTSHPTEGFRHWTMGCWGTTAFLSLVLRTVNIPVALVSCDGEHAMPSFLTLGAYLSHGDDPYSQLSRLRPRFPIDDLLIDQATFDTWFPATLGIRACNGRGRRPADLVVRDLPNDLLRVYCDDIRNGSSHASGEIFRGFFDGSIAVAELEALGLWSRMDAKIAAFGGCTGIP